MNTNLDLLAMLLVLSGPVIASLRPFTDRPPRAWDRSVVDLLASPPRNDDQISVESTDDVDTEDSEAGGESSAVGTSESSDSESFS